MLWKMEKLKHLYLPSHDYKVKGFPKLRVKFLKVKGLSSLEILKNYDTSRSQVTDLCKLDKMRKLSIKNNIPKIETIKVIKECPSMKNDRLVHLSLKIHGAILNKEATILSYCSCLRTLEMSGTNSSTTKMMLETFEFPENLMALIINNCELGCANPMQTFKQLHNLRSLSLDTVSFSENCMDFTQGNFLKLVDLRLSNLETLEVWKVGENAMPKLHSLHIYQCKALRMIPASLPTSVEVVCQPCVKGIDNYLTCPFHKVARVDDDDDDLATRQRKEYHL